VRDLTSPKQCKSTMTPRPRNGPDDSKTKREALAPNSLDRNGPAAEASQKTDRVYRCRRQRRRRRYEARCSVEGPCSRVRNDVTTASPQLRERSVQRAEAKCSTTLKIHSAEVRACQLSPLAPPSSFPQQACQPERR